MVNHITIGDIEPRKAYTADGAQTQFTVPFPFFVDGDLTVYLDDTLQVAGYTVAGAGQNSGGLVSFDVPPANAVVVTLVRAIAIQRTTDFQEGGEFRAKVINDELDYQTACLQQVFNSVGRCVAMSATASYAFDMTMPTPVVSGLLGVKADGTGFEFRDAASFIGPTGETGNTGNAGLDGTNGLDGADGKTLLSSYGLPGAGVGVDGDFCLDITNSIIYGPKAAGAWPTPGTSIIGPAGPGSGDVLAANNGSDFPDKPQVRINLGLGDSATKNTGTAVGTVAAGDHNHTGVYAVVAHNHAAVYEPLDATIIKEADIGTGLVVTAGTVTVDTGTTANKIVVLDGTAKLPAVDGSQLTNLPSTGGTPSGVVEMFAGSVQPTGYFWCDGATVSRTTYVDLFAAISTTYGVGDGSTTFNLPDMRGRAPIGVGMGASLTNRILADTGGEETHTLTTSEMPSHTHTQTGAGAFSANGGGQASSANNSANTGGAGGGAAHNVMQPFLALNFIIKT